MVADFQHNNQIEFFIIHILFVIQFLALIPVKTEKKKNETRNKLYESFENDPLTHFKIETSV